MAALGVVPVDPVRFEGWIAGLGTSAGLRVVVGRWEHSPLGAFTDVMVEHRGGHRMLLAPDPGIAEFVAATYRFDEVLLGLVDSAVCGTCWRVTAGPLRCTFRIGRRGPLGLLLRAVPRRLATDRRWLTVVDPIARVVVPGVRTRGTAGGGRREWYAALDLHRITEAQVSWDDRDCGSLTRVHPPVRFGFGSTPARPSLARMVTIVDPG